IFGIFDKCLVSGQNFDMVHFASASNTDFQLNDGVDASCCLILSESDPLNCSAMDHRWRNRHRATQPIESLHPERISSANEPESSVDVNERTDERRRSVFRI